METAKGKQQKPLRIAGIAGSPHRDGMTVRLLKQALRGAEAAGAETMLVHLADEKMEPCRGCEGNCWETRECVFDPGSAARHARLQDADGVVMAVPVYCWQMNSLTHLFIDKMRWDTGSVIESRNLRAAFGIACAGGSGTGCVLGLQALYRYFYNWAFHGIAPLPVTRFNFVNALEEAFAGGQALVAAIRGGLQPFPGLGEAIADLEGLPHMMDGPVDELRLIVRQLQAGLPETSEPLVSRLYAEAGLAEEAWAKGERQLAAAHLSKAYNAGSQAWGDRT
jgi:NAD(P)H-dependent FMN reductase